ncbi:MAG: hypothetical protein ABIR24_01615 [Verrucomicrobiota bacterium]
MESLSKKYVLRCQHKLATRSDPFFQAKGWKNSATQEISAVPISSDKVAQNYVDFRHPKKSTSNIPKNAKCSFIRLQKTMRLPSAAPPTVTLFSV